MSELAALWVDLGEITEARAASSGGTDFSRYKDDILGFAEHVLHVDTLWSKQREILVGIMTNTRFAHYGGNGTGKTFGDAVAILWMIYARGALVIATSALEAQLKSQLMRDVARLFHGADALGGELRTLGLHLPDRPDAGLICLAAGERHKLRGYHATTLGVWLGESQGLEPWVFESAAMMAVGTHDKVIASGNTDGGPTGPFYKACRLWPHVGVSALDHPNIVEGRTVIPGGPSREAVAQMAADYGVDSPFYVASVLGQWPKDVSESLFSLAALENAFDLFARGTHHATMSRGRMTIGADIARLGGDRTVLAILQGKVVTTFHAWGGVPLDQTVDRIIAAVATYGVHPVIEPNYAVENALVHAGAERLLAARPGDPLASQEHGRKATIRVDVIGVGGGVADELRRRRFAVEDFNSSASPTGEHAARYLNRRAQAYWRLRTELEAGRLALPPQWRDQLVAELMATTYAPGGEDKKRIQIAPKSLIKTRLGGKSPDVADALMQAVAADGSADFQTSLSESGASVIF